MQIVTKLIRCAAEVESVAIHIRSGDCLQLSLDRHELPFGIIFRPTRWLDPRIGFICGRRDDQQSASIYHTSKKRKSIADAQRFLLNPVERSLRALERLRLVGKPLQFDRSSQLRERKSPLRF